MLLINDNLVSQLFEEYVVEHLHFMSSLLQYPDGSFQTILLKKENMVLNIHRNHKAY